MQNKKRALFLCNEFLQDEKYSRIFEFLYASCKKAGIELICRSNAQYPVVFEKSALLHNVTNEFDFVLFWDKDILLANYLQAQGFRLFNNAGAIAVCDDKAQTHLALLQHGILMPKTVAAPMTFPNIGYTNTHFLQQVEESIGYPMIVKECRGSFGMQVYLARNRAQLDETLQKTGSVPVLFQQFILSVYRGYASDIRIHVTGDKVSAAMLRYSCNGDYRANISNGGKMLPLAPTEQQAQLAIRCCSYLGLDYGGVDILTDPDGISYVCEVNSNAHFKNIYDCTGVNMADEIICHISRQIYGAK